MAEQPKPKRPERIGQDDQDAVDLDALMRDYARQSRADDYLAQLEAEYRAEQKRKNEARTWRGQVEDFLRAPYPESYAPKAVESSAAERTWAAAAHLALLIGVPLSVGSGGVLGAAVALAPLLIYLSHRERSPFVEQHAMQALLALLGSTLGWFGLSIAGLVFGIVATILLTITLVGVVIVPFLWLGLLLVWLALLALPFGAFFLSMVGAAQALRGRTFRYPYVGKLTR